MSERESATIHVSVPNPEQRAFIQEHARLFFGGNVSGYIVSLVKFDQEQSVTRKEMIARLTETANEGKAA